MYGGLQAAIGVMAVVALFRSELRRPYVLLVAFLCAGLGIARLIGVVIEAELSAYTALALAFEVVAVALAVWLLRRPGAVPA